MTRRIAFDTNLLRPRSVRLFFGTLQEYNKDVLPILPTVRTELYKEIPESFADYWKSRLWHEQKRNRIAPLEYDIEATIGEAVRQTAKDWLDREIDNPDGVLMQVDPAYTAKKEVEKLRHYMPDQFFDERGRSRENVENDKRIIAETILYGVNIVTTNNMEHVRDIRLIEWLSKNRLCERKDLIISADAGVDYLNPYDGSKGARLLYRCALLAGLPKENNAGKHQAAMDRHIGQLSSGGLSATAKAIRAEQELDPSPMLSIASTYKNRPTKILAAQQRLDSAGEHAARAAGYAR